MTEGSTTKGSTRNDVLARVRKLLSLAQSSNQHEAQAAHTHAELLMKRHGLTRGEVDDEALAGIGEHTIIGIDFGSTWRFALLNAVATRYGCKAIRIFSAPPVAGAVVGHTENAALVEFVFRKLEGDVTRLAERNFDATFARLKREVHEEAIALLGEERSVRRANDWARAWRSHNETDVLNSFCLGATMLLQRRLLEEDEEIAVCYADVLRTTAIAAVAVPAVPGPEPDGDEIAPEEALMDAGTTNRALEVLAASSAPRPSEPPASTRTRIWNADHEADAVRRHMQQKTASRWQSSDLTIDSESLDQKAYAHGRRAGARISMPRTETEIISPPPAPAPIVPPPPEPARAPLAQGQKAEPERPEPERPEAEATSANS